MSYVITQGCCSDASCVSVCPVYCIHPSPDEPDYGTTSMLYVDPKACIDCGACADACPVDAILPEETLTGVQAEYIAINRAFYVGRAVSISNTPRFPHAIPNSVGPLRIAVVGSGPAGHYITDELLRACEAEVTMIDRLPVSGGLLRYGVAPDHPLTKRLTDRFLTLMRNPRVDMMLGATVGKDVSVAELAQSFHAVVYAVGAAQGRDLGIPGEELRGSIRATDVVSWYNAHPEATRLPHGLQEDRAVIIGNGNVALDVARMLLLDPELLAQTDIAEHALTALRQSRVREVVLVARRGPTEAAYTEGELLALKYLPGIELAVADTPGVGEAIDSAPDGSITALLRDVPRIPGDAPLPSGKRIVLRFNAVSQSIEGKDGEVSSIVFRDNGSDNADAGSFSINTGLVIRAIGYQASAIDGLPFDTATSTVPNEHGRVIDPATGRVVAGAYAVGWFKRGANGGIGTNRQDATDTVESILADAAALRLPTPTRSVRALRASVRSRVPGLVDRDGLFAIEAAERHSGVKAGRPRVKFVSTDALLAASRHH